MSDIVTPLRWKRTDEEKPPFGKWVWGLFVSETGSSIRECERYHDDTIWFWVVGKGHRSDVPLLWSNPEDVIQGLMEVIDGNGVNHDTR